MERLIKSRMENKRIVYKHPDGTFASDRETVEYIARVKEEWLEGMDFKKELTGEYIKRNILHKEYEFAIGRVDRIDDIDFAFFVQSMYLEHFSEYEGVVILQSESQVNHLGIEGDWVSDSEFISDSESAYYSALNQVMRGVRASGCYMQKSAWRYAKIKTKKDMTESVFVRGKFITMERV